MSAGPIIIGILIFAALLIGLALILKAVCKPAPSSPAQAIQPVYVPPVALPIEKAALEDEEDELAAVIAAVLAVCAQSGNGLVVRQIRRVGETAPIWSVSGRRDNILNQA